jgi:hypothetical protein
MYHGDFIDLMGLSGISWDFMGTYRDFMGFNGTWRMIYPPTQHGKLENPP